MSASTYRTWLQMRHRCNKGSWASKYYYDRGIKVCKRWNKFENFLNDMGNRPNDTSIDRINNNGGYKPSNCRWATRHQQARNNRRNVYIEYKNKCLCIKDWATLAGIKKNTFYARLRYGWPMEKAISKQNFRYKNKRLNKND